MLVPSYFIAKSPNIVSRIVGKEAVIILPELGELKVLNEVGARLWDLSDGTRTIADLVDIICVEYAVAREQAEQDVLDFLQQMVAKKMLIVVE